MKLFILMFMILFLLSCNNNIENNYESGIKNSNNVPNCSELSKEDRLIYQCKMNKNE